MWPLTESLIRQKLVAQRRRGYEKMQTLLSGNSASRGKQTRLPHSGADWQYNHGRLPGGNVCLSPRALVTVLECPAGVSGRPGAWVWTGEEGSSSRRGVRKELRHLFTAGLRTNSCDSQIGAKCREPRGS